MLPTAIKYLGSKRLIVMVLIIIEIINNYDNEYDNDDYDEDIYLHQSNSSKNNN